MLGELVAAAAAHGERGVLLLDAVPALRMRRLAGLVLIEEEPGEVLEDAHRLIDGEDLHGEHAVAQRVAQIEGQREALGVAALAGVFGAVEADHPGGDIVGADHARRLVVGGIGGGEQVPQAARAELAFVLRHGAGVGRRAVHPEAVGLERLHRGEGALALGRRGPQRERALAVERTVLQLQLEAAVGDRQLVGGAAGDGEVALVRVEGSLDHPQLLHQLGDDEVRVGVSLGVGIVDLVDGDTVDGELDGLSLLGVEAAQENLVGMAGPTLVGDEDSRREPEDVGGAVAGDDGQLSHLDLEVAASAELLALGAAHLHFQRRAPIGQCRYGFGAGLGNWNDGRGRGRRE